MGERVPGEAFTFAFCHVGKTQFQIDAGDVTTGAGESVGDGAQDPGELRNHSHGQTREHPGKGNQHPGGPDPDVIDFQALFPAALFLLWRGLGGLIHWAASR